MCDKHKNNTNKQTNIEISAEPNGGNESGKWLWKFQNWTKEKKHKLEKKNQGKK